MAASPRPAAASAAAAPHDGPARKTFHVGDRGLPAQPGAAQDTGATTVMPTVRAPRGPSLNDTTKDVVSSALTTPTWRNSEIIGPYDARKIQALKEETAKGLYVSGSATLVHALLADGLVDEVHLFVFPLNRSAGVRLFDESVPPARWNRANAALYDHGVVYLHLNPT